MSGRRSGKRLVVEELVGGLYGLRGERAVQRAGHQFQRAVVVMVQERKHFTVVQRPPSLVFGQPQRITALGLGRFYARGDGQSFYDPVGPTHLLLKEKKKNYLFSVPSFWNLRAG